jgi:hypothetical protein
MDSRRTLQCRRLALTLVAIVAIVVASLSWVAQQQASRAAPAKSAQLGLFWNDPKDGTSVETIAATARIVSVSQGRETYRDSLRAAGYTGKVLQYMLAGEVEGPGPYANSSAACNSSYTPLHNQVADQRGDFCRYIHPNESWFVHNGAGKRLYATEGTRVKYYMNLASPGWRAFARARMVADLQSLGYDGIFLDNVDLSRFRVTSRVNNADGTVRELPSDAAYREAWVGYLQVLSGAIRPGKQLWGNLTADLFDGTNWNAYMQHLDGAMSEGFATGYSASGLSVSRWTNMMQQAETAMAAGKGVLAVAQGEKADNARQTFGLASLLLVSDTTNGYFRYAKAGHYDQWWLYNNYDISLGAPRGPRYQVGAVWKRDFACGTVTADPHLRTGTITATSCTSTPAPAPTSTPSPTPTATSTPSPIPPWANRFSLPGTFEAEDYRSGGADIAYHDTTAGNTGATYRLDDVDIQRCTDAALVGPCYNVGWVEAGEWLAYNVSTSDVGYYTFTVRVAAKNAGKTFHIEVGGQDVSGSITVPHTGGYQTWADAATGPIRLSAGNHTLRIVAETDGFNLNFVNVTKL